MFTYELQRRLAAAGATTIAGAVFRLIARGLSNAEIGRELYITDTTVKPTSPTS